MNWGWFYNDFNGWFYLYDWNPGYYTFNYGQSMIYEIIP